MDLLTILFWTNLPNAGGTMPSEASATGTAGTWFDIFWTLVDVTPGTTYFLVITGNTTLGTAGETTNPYPNGMSYNNPGYTTYPNFD